LSSVFHNKLQMAFSVSISEKRNGLWDSATILQIVKFIEHCMTADIKVMMMLI